MEEKFMKEHGLELVNSSELVNVRGGWSWPKELYEELVKITVAIERFVREYQDDFIEGLKQGWKMI